ncbi:DNA-binding protein [Coriobacteriales bacterium OH1046]|jgi:excisionase family DNA binding protein|nr:DNA-binding protein [Coriobacteriales bacterium OH1046]
MTREKTMPRIDAATRRAIREDRLRPRCKADHDRLSLANSSMPDTEIWLDVRAVELYFQVDRRRIYRLIEGGKLPHERVGRKILINKQAASAAFGNVTGNR